jgi:diaminohydroxyphosphoribosylaminopyrimidine deaminase/5-amino-6-(5-phosphoribosylamino)uracil reductase
MTEPEHSTIDRTWLRMAIELSTQCSPSPNAFSVGAVIIDATNQIMAIGYSRETDPTVHAEEAALAKLAPDDPRLPHATLYSSMEPCGQRKSRPHSCAHLIINAGIPRVVYALAEPPTFVTPAGARTFRTAHIHVIHITDLAPSAAKINNHLLT